MKAIVQDRFGPPDVLQLVDTGLPEVGSDDVLVRVHAAAVNPYDWQMMRGDPLIARLMGGVRLSRPKARVAGVDAAGRVEAVGANVRGLRPGDEVLGFCSGAFAEYARAAADQVVPKPVKRSPRAGGGGADGRGDGAARDPGCGCGAGRAAGRTCSPSPGSSRPASSHRSLTGPIRWPTPPTACATWSRGTHAARSSSPCREAREGHENQPTYTHIVLPACPTRLGRGARRTLSLAAAH
jgi:hypothetical protein